MCSHDPHVVFHGFGNTTKSDLLTYFVEVKIWSKNCKSGDFFATFGTSDVRGLLLRCVQRLLTCVDSLLPEQLFCHQLPIPSALPEQAREPRAEPESSSPVELNLNTQKCFLFILRCHKHRYSLQWQHSSLEFCHGHSWFVCSWLRGTWNMCRVLIRLNSFPASTMVQFVKDHSHGFSKSL